LSTIDPGLPPSDLFRARDLQTLTRLDGGDELRCLQQTFGRFDVEPGEPAPEQFQFKTALSQIMIIQVADLKLAARRGFRCGGISATSSS